MNKEMFLKAFEEKVVDFSSDLFGLMAEGLNNGAVAEDMLCKTKPNGNLESMLKCLDNASLSETLDFYEIPQRKKKNLPETIKDRFINNLSELRLADAIVFKEICDNGYSFKLSSLSILSCFVFGYKEDDKIIFVMPEELKEIFKEFYTAEAKGKVINGEINETLIGLLFIYGALTIQEFTNIFNERFTTNLSPEDIKSSIDLNEFKTFTYDGVCHVCMKELGIDDMSWMGETRHVTNNIEELKYTSVLSSIKGVIYEKCEHVDEDSYQSFLVNVLLKKEMNTNKLIPLIDNEFGIKDGFKDYLGKCLSKISSKIRYYTLRGYNKDEIILNTLLLEEKPRDNKLITILDDFSSKNIDELNKLYHSKNNSKVEKNIIKACKNDMLMDFICKDDILEILDENEKEYDLEHLNRYLLKGYFYLYRDGNKLMFFIPDEIKEILNSIEDDDYDSSYYQQLGKLLTEMLKNNG